MEAVADSPVAGFDVDLSAVDQANSRFADVPLSKLRHAQNALRDVDQRNPQFVELAESVRQFGVQEAITVCERIDENTQEMYYLAVNGAQRTMASRLAGYTTIPARIIELADNEILERQILANAVQVDTKKYQFAKAINDLLKANPEHTLASLSKRFGKSAAWISSILSLVNLTPELGKLVDEDRITLANAVALTTLPAEVQGEYLQQAIVTPVSDFQTLIKQRRDAIRKAKLSGKSEEQVFVAVPHLRPIAELKSALDNSTAVKTVVDEAGAATPLDAAIAILNWVLKLDPKTIEAAKAKFEQDMAMAKEKRDASAKERAERKAFVDGKKAERSSLHMSLVNGGKSVDEVKVALEEFDNKLKAEIEARYPKKTAAANETAPAA